MKTEAEMKQYRCGVIGHRLEKLLQQERNTKMVLENEIKNLSI